MNSSVSYVVCECYYKHGENDMHIVSEANMRNFCLDKLSTYYEYTKEWEEYKYNYEKCSDYVKSKYADHNLEDIIKSTLDKGNKHINKERGWGITHIIRGENLVNIE